jgi:hypothetical protein
MPGFDAYTSNPSMYEVHKFMDLDTHEVAYFISQVGLAAASFGVTETDATAVGMALMNLFGYKCAPPTTAIKAQGPQLQSICIAEDCPLAVNAVCDEYGQVVEPEPTVTTNGSMSTTATSGMPSGTGSMTVHPGTSATTIPTAAAPKNGLSIAAIIAALIGFTF